MADKSTAPGHRRAFWRRTVTNGWAWAKGVLDSASRFILLAAVFGVPTGIFILKGSPIGIAVGAALVVVVCLGEGAYQTWHDVHLKLESYELAKVAEPELRLGNDSEWRTTFDAATMTTKHFRPTGGAVATTQQYVIRINNHSLVNADRIRVRLISVEPPSAGTDLPCDLATFDANGRYLEAMKDIPADGHEYAVLTTLHTLIDGTTSWEGHLTITDEPVTANLQLWRGTRVHDSKSFTVNQPGLP